MSGGEKQAFGYVRQFTIIPGVVIEKRLPRLGGNGMVLMTIVLHIAGKNRSDTALVSHRTLQDLTGWSINRIRDAKRELCEAIPEAFTLIPGDSAARRPDAIHFNRAALEALHHEHLAEHGNYAGNQHSRMSETDTGLYPKQTEGCIRNGSNKKSTNQDVKYSFSQLASLAEGAEEQIRVSGPEVQDGKQRQEAEVAKRSKPATRGTTLSNMDAQRFAAIWNEGRHPRFAEKRILSDEERGRLDALVNAHNRDLGAALESWTLAVGEVARMGANPDERFWGDRTRRPAMANLLRNWSQHADAAMARTCLPSHTTTTTDMAPQEI